MISIVHLLLRLLSPVYKALGVDNVQLRAIVGTKLMMDNRRSTTAFQQQKKESSSSFRIVLLLYLAFGGFVAIAIASLPSFLVSMTLYHSYLMVLISMTLISDFSSVLLDTSDNTIILPRPVSGKTLVAARITHILLYIGQIALALMIVPLIVTFIYFGTTITLLVFITTLLSVIFAVVFTNGFYMLLMQFTNEERLKSIINYFQIGMTITIMGGYQILPRIMGAKLIEALDFKMSWWSVFVPPFWMSGALDLFHSKDFDWIHITSLVLAFGGPIGGFYVINKYLAPQFGNKLTDLGTNSVAKGGQKEKSKNGFQLSEWITLPGLERAAYVLTSAIMSRDRKLKLKIYPSIASFLVLAFVIIVNGKSSIRIMFNNLPRTSTHIFLLYGGFFVIQTILAEISYNDEFKAAWIYTSAPLARPGEILSGAWKAVIVKFFIPIFLVTTTFVLFIWGEKAFDDIFFAIGSNLFLFLAVANIGAKKFPFSLEPSTKAQAGSFIRVISVFLILAVVGGLHFFLSKIDYVLWIGGPLLFGGSLFLLKGLRDTGWKEITT